MSSNKNFRRIKIDERVEKYLLLTATPEKKLLKIISNLKDIFPNQKTWNNLTENRDQKLAELITKFQKRGKLYREVGKNWLTNNNNLAEDFSTFTKTFEGEISTEEVVKFFRKLMKDRSVNIIDIAIFIHIYVEQVVGMQLFEESNEVIEKEVNEFFNKNK
jgi:hypothetical protein